MLIIKRGALALSAMAVAATAALGLAVPAASASTTLTATTHLTNRLDGGHNTLGAPFWATDTMTRIATLVDNGPDPQRSGFDTYSFSLSDTGTFVTNTNVGNPNGLDATTPITGTVTGTITGTGTWTTFDAPTGSANAGLVPANQSGNVTPSSQWPGLFFPQGTDFECPGVQLTAALTAVNPPFPPSGCGQESAYSYTYKSCTEQWVDSNADNDGNAVGQTPAQQAVIGGISGKACPSPKPSPPTTTTTKIPVGGVQTGGGKPTSSTPLEWMVILASLSTVILAGFGIARLRNHQG